MKNYQRTVFFLAMPLTTVVFLAVALRFIARSTLQGELRAGSDPHRQMLAAQLPVSFEPFKPSQESPFQFMSKGIGYSMFLSPTEAVLRIRTGAKTASSQPPWEDDHSYLLARMNLIGADRQSRMSGVDVLPTQNHYLLGADPRQWRTHVPSYKKVRAQSVYPGVDLLYYGKDGKLEFDFVLQAGADPRQIAFSWEREDASASLRVDTDGSLVMTSAGLEIRQHRPRAYQWIRGEETTIAAGYQLNSHNQITFDLGRYDPAHPLVIDPVLSFSSSLGGNMGDQGVAVAVDSSGSAYVAGTTDSLDFPAARSIPAQTLGSARGKTDVFVLKIDAQTNLPVFVAYLGGSSNDNALGIAVDSTQSVYVMAGTSSSNFPLTSGAFQTVRRGAWDAVVCKLGPTGGTLMFSTLLGGNGIGDAEGLTGGLAIDTAGNVFVTGSTDSMDFPVTAAAFQPFFGRGENDAFLAQVNTTGTGLIFSSYLGGSGLDLGNSIAIDAFGYAYVTGKTRSRDFPTVRALQSSRSGTTDDAFVAKISPGGTFLSFSTYLGGSADDEGRGIAVDITDDEEAIYVTGSTFSTNFPTTVNAYKDEQSRIEEEAHNWDAFVVKLDTTEAGSGVLAYGTYLGGSSDDYGYALALSGSRKVYVTGTTRSFDFPSVEPVQQPSEDSSRQDAFVTKVDPSRAEQLVYSTVLGGGGSESGLAVALDQQGNAWVTGVTESVDFPTVSPIQPQGTGGQDAFLVKIADGDGSPARPVITAGVSLNPPSTTYQVGQEIIAEFTLTNKGGRPISFQKLTVSETDPNNAVPDFSHALDVVVDGGSSYDYEGTLTLTRAGTFQFTVAYQTTDGQWHVDVPVEEGSRNNLQITVEESSSAATENAISSSAENDECLIPFSDNTCSVTISWSSINIDKDQVHVYVEDVGVGSSTSVFASGKSGTQVADWIQGPPHRYKFTLNQVVAGVRSELDSVIVSAKQDDPTAETAILYASANPCLIEAGRNTCTSVINWTVLDDTTETEVFVEDVGAGGGRSLFAGSELPSGSSAADWVQGPPHRYVFTLYRVASNPRIQTQLAAVEVTGRRPGAVGNRSGTISAGPNPCTITESHNSCSTIISWSTAEHVTDATIAMRNVHRNTNYFFARGKSGAVTTDLIQAPPNRYIFTLYRVDSGKLTALDSVEVTSVEGAH